MNDRFRTCGRAALLAIALWACCANARAVDDAAIFAHAAGIWRIAAKGTLKRWIVIHNLEDARTSGIFHIEVIGRQQGKPVWAIEHVCNHMAITLAALSRSVQAPLKTGAVYPEAFDVAFGAWQKTPAAQQDICSTSVIECLPKTRSSVR